MVSRATISTIVDMNIHTKATADSALGSPDAGAATHPVDVLSREHQTILVVLGVMDAEQHRLVDGALVRRPFWAAVLEFLEHYADRCHHGKEEQLLFVELERAGLPAEHGPTACMRKEHEIGRQSRQAMVAAVREGDGAALATAAGGYVELLREHIAKEDQVLFPMAKSVLDQAAVARLRRGFARVDHHDLGAGSHGKYEELARGLAADGARPPQC